MGANPESVPLIGKKRQDAPRQADRAVVLEIMQRAPAELAHTGGELDFAFFYPYNTIDCKK